MSVDYNVLEKFKRGELYDNENKEIVTDISK